MAAKYLLDTFGAASKEELQNAEGKVAQQALQLDQLEKDRGNGPMRVPSAVHGTKLRPMRSAPRRAFPANTVTNVPPASPTSLLAASPAIVTRIGAMSGGERPGKWTMPLQKQLRGIHFDRCAKGYFQEKNANECFYCDCDPSRTEDNVCDGETGQCLCKPGFAGRRCDRCDDHFFGYPSCRDCQCHERIWKMSIAANVGVARPAKVPLLPLPLRNTMQTEIVQQSAKINSLEAEKNTMRTEIVQQSAKINSLEAEKEALKQKTGEQGKKMVEMAKQVEQQRKNMDERMEAQARQIAEIAEGLGRTMERLERSGQAEARETEKMKVFVREAASQMPSSSTPSSSHHSAHTAIGAWDVCPYCDKTFTTPEAHTKHVSSAHFLDV